ncbi:4562_t:CDS:2, partial [Rhizophagus irregularis]
ELLNARRGANWVENDKRRRHANSRRSDKRKRRSKIIDKLTTLKDQLTENRYHSPEESETDEDNPNKHKIVIRDLKWRSSS